MLYEITPPSVEPVTLAEAKVHCRVDADLTADDALIRSLIAGSRRFAESYLGRSLIARNLRLVADEFPSDEFLLDRGNVLSVASIQYQDAASAWQTLVASTYVAELSGCPARVALAFNQVWPSIYSQIGAVKLDYMAGYATAITVDATADTIAPALWPTLVVNDTVTFYVSHDATGALPSPLVAGRTYYIQSIPVAGSYKLSATAGGAAIDLTTTGTGQIYLGIVPEGIRDWILLRVATRYKFREEAGERTFAAMPYVNNLLDPYRVVLA